jgi:FemAB-related protein (PEP-CTERM system-associated)
MTLVVGRYEGDGVAWDAFVRAQPGWTHFHLYGWRRVIGAVFGHDCPYLAATDGDGQLVGVLPLVHVRSLVFGQFIVSMPFVNYGGPLGSDAAIRALAGFAIGLAADARGALLELRSRHALPIELPASHRKITVTRELPPTADALWASLNAKVRSQIRRPRKEGVKLRFGPTELEPFFQVFSKHMRDLGTPTQPRHLFEALLAEFGEDIVFCSAYLGDTPVAAGCAIRWGAECEMTWASSLVQFKSVSANMLLYWGMMEHAIAHGVATFNFGRCTPGSGTHRFKEQWGGLDEPLWWYHASERGVVKAPSPSDSAYSWGPRVWKRLPVAVATTLGPRIVRYIP